MKKSKLILRAAVILAAVLMCTCCTADTDTADTVDTQSTASSTSASREKCTVHHSDYHSIPTELALYVGESAANEWIAARDPESEDDGDGCPCSGRNIKAFIEEFDIPREIFAAKADLAHHPTYDCELLYGEDADTLELYFRDTDALVRENIKAQHLSFLEHLILSDYTEEMMSMIVSDSTGAHGSSPSVPQAAQVLKIPREKLEEYIKTADEMTEQTCGELRSYDYDLDMIYNADGTYRTLPTTENLSDYDRILTLNRMFCRLGA